MHLDLGVLHPGCHSPPSCLLWSRHCVVREYVSRGACRRILSMRWSTSGTTLTKSGARCVGPEMQHQSYSLILMSPLKARIQHARRALSLPRGTCQNSQVSSKLRWDMRFDHPKQRSREFIQSCVWSTRLTVATGLGDMQTRRTSPRCSSCRCFPSKETHTDDRAFSSTHSSRSA